MIRELDTYLAAGVAVVGFILICVLLLCVAGFFAWRLIS